MDISKLKGQGRFSIPHGKRFIVLVAIAAVLGVVALFTYVDFGSSPVSKLKSGTTEQRLAAIDQLAADGSDKAMRAIAEVTDDEDTAVACRALLALAGGKFKDRREYIERALGDGRAEVRRVATVGIGLQKDKAKDADMLAKVLRNTKEDPQVRAAAADALGNVRGWAQRHALIDALDDESELVRGRAAAALRRILSMDFGFHAADPKQDRDKAIAKIRKYLE